MAIIEISTLNIGDDELKALMAEINARLAAIEASLRTVLANQARTIEDQAKLDAAVGQVKINTAAIEQIQK